ncbi:peptidoglycan-binding domain-containing protein [Micromonospora endophytica]|uniref:Uncharacterized protein n=1 Tax=Micromonospora endophytica TaxID=515350 RepID=A0A2W2DJA1_9ACTN|nr:peptidoglycan-binding domain-containing protein [Micromonospora endophytica]PZG00910.1 hypothetical protein C1I93_01160 [Micromonospora endophytica]RIW46249.1 peptidoglycan-binding protein [Micromonospora endophytica]BCJ61766.1 hypothetical protein Jiend_51880 [Micromonospora endophytica]
MADDERERSHFGPRTREAVTRIQALLGLPPTGEVDAGLLDLAAAARDRLGGGREQDPGVRVVEGAVSAGIGKTPVREVLTRAARLPAEKQRLFMRR